MPNTSMLKLARVTLKLYLQESCILFITFPTQLHIFFTGRRDNVKALGKMLEN
jgi:hypothetical protein